MKLLSLFKKPKPPRKQYFNSRVPAHKPGYYLNDEQLWRNRGHVCNTACRIDTLEHWMQS